MKRRQMSAVLLALTLAAANVAPVYAADETSTGEVVQAEAEPEQEAESSESASAVTDAPEAEGEEAAVTVQPETEAEQPAAAAETEAETETAGESTGDTAEAETKELTALEKVEEEIKTLEVDGSQYTGSAEEREKVEAVYKDYLALSAEDQAVIDEKVVASVDGQPLGRVLEAAYWTVHSFDAVDNSTILPDGIYNSTTTPALSSAYSKGKSTSSRQVPWDVQEVTVKDGKAYATIHVASKNYSRILYNGQTYARTGGSGKNSLFANVPIDLNSTFYFNGVSSMPRPIAFRLETTIEEKAAPPEAEKEELEITNNTGMFKAVTAHLEKKEGKTELVMALSGSGYHELFKGTFEEAVANGDNTDAWIHGEQNADGYWEFRIPVEEGESYMPIVAISNSYYNKYLKGTNSLARAFYPRQAEINVEAKTLVTGDYKSGKKLNITNNVKMLKVTGAELETIGGPNSNGYKSNLTLTMGSAAYDKAYLGSGKYAEESTAIALGEGNTFVLPVKFVKEFGKPETLSNLLEAPFTVSFHSAKNGTWYDRQFDVTEKDGMLVIDDLKADYAAVDAALAKVPEDLSVYTDESAAKIKEAVAAVKRDQNAGLQADVDAMAEGIEEAVAGLEKKPVQVQGTWKKVKGTWYYVDSKGKPLPGKQVIKGKTYFIASNGAMKTGWNKEGTDWYYYNTPDGDMATGWKQLKGVWYYMDGTGKMATGRQTVKGKIYFFNSEGAMKTGWNKEGSDWYYYNGDGAMATGWKQLKGVWYYMDGTGKMATGRQTVKGKTYFFNGSGAMKTGWNKEGGDWYYYNGDGAMATGWKQLKGIWYYMDGAGKMATGKQTVKGKTYFFNGSGAMKTGWNKEGTDWYYYNTPNGDMATGWIQVKGAWYYLNKDGKMAANTRIGTYYVDGSGKWIKGR